RKLPAFKVGRQWRFSEARIEAWVEDHERLA
ncbi:MAG: helix-turn-helix domain-containing protein, partial [Candidatus Omnitrophica bacterium]|nr:helix-turn-helix domain-containing protein [Candidatus Omnitrophota bacterium]